MSYKAVRFCLLVVCATFSVLSFSLQAQHKKVLQVQSPDGIIKFKISVVPTLQWSLEVNNKVVMPFTELSMELLNGKVLGRATSGFTSRTQSIKNKIQSPFYKKSVVDDSYEQLTLTYKDGYGVIVRVYNDGAAFRFFTQMTDSITIKTENVSFQFAQDHQTYFPYVNSPRNKDIFICSYENEYVHVPVSQIKSDTLGFLPVLVEIHDSLKVAITEADLEEFPGLYVRAGSKFNFLGVHAQAALEEQESRSGIQRFVAKREPYIAKSNGTRVFPWRVLVVAKTDQQLLNNDMVYRLASPSRIHDTSWIKPGKVAWDWWNNLNLSHVDFEAGINTKTYKYFIDFAAAYKLEYILLDEGWSKKGTLLETNPAIDLEAIIRYADEKNVGVWLWAGWAQLDREMQQAIPKYAAMGVKGFKIDFMDRDDQGVVQFYYRTAALAAEHKLLLDFHGAYKPTGLQRTYPNVLNFEGVRGLENVKWSNTDFPGYDCTVPFIRMIAGPMDYTPGAMKNATKQNFAITFNTPMSQGTRCHQLALYVLYESPLVMLADSPSDYYRENESTSFIASIPTVFTNTIALNGKVGEYLSIARANGNTWYIGSITNWQARDIQLDLSFLGAGEYKATIFQDGLNAHREGTDYSTKEIVVSNSDKLNIHLAPGGGWAARIIPVGK